MAVGREGGFASSVSARFGAWFGKEQLAAPGVADPEKMKKTLDTVAETTNVPPRDAAVDSQRHVGRGQGIRRRSRTQARRAVEGDSGGLHHRQPNGCWRRSRPRIPRSATTPPRAAKTVALKMMSEPLTVTYAGKRGRSLRPISAR